jgi:hypothetical protein
MNSLILYQQLYFVLLLLVSKSTLFQTLLDHAVSFVHFL